nr:MAG TPA: hypothetical protein [Caudoviricetes sp.]
MISGTKLQYFQKMRNLFIQHPPKMMQHPRTFLHVSSCRLNMEPSGVKGELQKKYIRMAVPMFLQSRPPQGNCLLNPVPPMIRSVSF